LTDTSRYPSFIPFSSVTVIWIMVFPFSSVVFVPIPDKPLIVIVASFMGFPSVSFAYMVMLSSAVFLFSGMRFTIGWIVIIILFGNMQGFRM